MDIPQAFVNGYYSLTAGRTYDRLMSRFAGSRKEFWENVPLAPADRVLEVGVGTGLNFAHYPPARYTGVDINRSMLRKAARRAQRLGLEIELLRSDARALPFEDAAFDKGVMTFALSAIPSNAAAYAQLERVVRPGGMIAVLDMVLSPASAWCGYAKLELTDFLETRERSVVLQRNVVGSRWGNAEVMYLMGVR